MFSNMMTGRHKPVRNTYSVDQNDASLMILSHHNKMIYRWLYHVTAPENYIMLQNYN